MKICNKFLKARNILCLKFSSISNPYYMEKVIEFKITFFSVLFGVLCVHWDGTIAMTCSKSALSPMSLLTAVPQPTAFK